MAHELAVWLFEECVGTLAMSDGRLNFSYLPEWLSRANAIALSASLPLRAEPFDDAKVRPFFAGLLPEGQLRRLIAQQFQVSDQNDFALLDRLGGDCAGAVALLPPGHALPDSAHDAQVEWLDDKQVIAILDELPRRPMLAGRDGLRLSLAGAQDKLPVVFDGERIGLPRDGTPSSHILKPAIDAIEDSVINEGFCMALADAMQLAVAKATIHTISNRSFLLVARYDRVVGGQGHRMRVHQEDFCQALGVVPEMKYQNEGGPDLAKCFELVRRVTRPNAPQVLRLLDQVMFNALIGNHDAHGKNFSLLYSAERANHAAVLSPAYDLLSTAVYPELTPKMAMKIGSKYKFSEVQARHWEQLAESAGLSKPQTKKRLLEFASALPQTAREVQAGNARLFVGNALVGRIIELIEQRCEQTIRRFSLAAK